MLCCLPRSPADASHVLRLTQPRGSWLRVARPEIGRWPGGAGAARAEGTASRGSGGLVGCGMDVAAIGVAP